ncbi:MAG: hypothetical protein LBC29_05955 [Propionibacteriaceae bacterium]|jgi:hypothetical protein|nr:hypothetical protein [Propionibacteriaceae bacterium]
MPTTLDRHTITETPEIAAALDIAALRWPGKTRAELVRQVLVESAEQMLASAEHRRRMIEKYAGVFTGTYPADWDEQRKAEWPE